MTTTTATSSSEATPVSGRQITFTEAMVEALDFALAEDDRVFLLGEDIGAMGGVSGQTRGLYEKYGNDRILDAPISEAGFFGMAAGAAQRGFRPVVELMRVDFFGVAMDQIYNYIAKIGYCANGRTRVPLTVMTQVGNPLRQGAVHAQTLYGTFAHVPGLKLVAPATSYDAKGLLRAAIRADDPVMFFFHSSLLAIPYGPGIEEWTALPVPDEDYEIPLGQARTIRPGADVTVVSWSHTIHDCLRAAQAVEQDGISCEVIDARTLVPFDTTTLFDSLGRTKRLVVVDEDYRFAGMSAEIIALAVESGVQLQASPARVTRDHVPIPYSVVLDDEVRPSTQKIEAAIRGLFK